MNDSNKQASTVQSNPDSVVITKGCSIKRTATDMARARASSMGKSLPRSFSPYVFMLNGDRSFDYDYARSDIKLINNVFTTLGGMKEFKGVSMMYVFLFHALRGIMNVSQYAPEIPVCKNKNSFVFMHSNFTNGRQRSVFMESLGIKGFVVMNLDVQESLDALRAMVKYGLEDVIAMVALLDSIDAPSSPDSVHTLDINKQDYRAVIREAIIHDNKLVSRIIVKFLSLIVNDKLELECPSYDELCRMTGLPGPIIDTNIEAGDFDRPYYSLRFRMRDELEEDSNLARKSLMKSLIDSRNMLALNDIDINDYNSKVLDSVHELMLPKYNDAWDVFKDVGIVYNKFRYNPYCILGLLPWRIDGMQYSVFLTADLLNEILPDASKVSRLYALLAAREATSSLWVSADGYGYGCDANISRRNVASKRKLCAFLPRRYWDSDGVEHDLSGDFVSQLGYGLDSESVMPPELLDYIRNGVVPESLTVDKYWMVYSYAVKDGVSVINDGKRIRNSYGSGSYNNEDNLLRDARMTFKLRTPETEDAWRKWAKTLEKV